ncbi:MAG: PadR family transcriptional regulator [Promethearchaeota archaeon]
MPYESKNLSLNDITVLGLVAESKEPVNGQTLEKVIQNREMRVWTKIGKSSVYHALKKLENTKLLQSEKKVIERAGSSPPVTKIFYDITNEGKQKLRQAIINTIARAEKVIDPFDIALANAPLLSKTELVEALNDRLKKIEQRQQLLSEKLSSFKHEVTGLCDEGLPTHENILFVQGLFSRPLEFLNCEKKWIIAFLEELNKYEWMEI